MTWFKNLHPMQKILIFFVPLFAYALYEVLRNERMYGMTTDIWFRMSLLGKLCAIACFLAPFIAIIWAIVENVKRKKYGK